MDTKIVLLGGNSHENKDWIERISRLLPVPTHTVVYKHWKNNAQLINLDAESLRLEQLKPAVVFAKSAGILVTLKGVFERKIAPTYCIFAGVPLHWSEKNNFPLLQWLMKWNIPTTFIQNSHDPTCSAEELKELLNECQVKNHKLTTLRGETHDYPVEEVVNSIKEHV
ncbi:MAG TPA: hypothetical protein VJJ82_01245 [Candidatus Nanoarchaeia archaeon]|nr:hypothetical protein [Candidatus Nanoarchaeia archaeon]